MPVCRNACFNPRLKYYNAGDVENDEDAIAILREDNQLQHFADSRGRPYPENTPAPAEEPKKRGRKPAAPEGSEEEPAEDITPEGSEG